MDNLVAACTACNEKASSLMFADFERKKAFVLDPTKKTPSVLECRARRQRHANHPWHKPVNSKKLPPSGRFGQLHRDDGS